LFERIKHHHHLQSFELCFNSIGNKYKQSVPKIGVQLGEMFKHNRNLIHVDFSMCGFTKNDCAQISIGLNENHHVLGLHFNGNEMGIDEYGFLSIDNKH